MILLSSPRVGPGDRKMLRLSGKCLYRMSHLVDTEISFLEKKEGNNIGSWKSAA